MKINCKNLILSILFVITLSCNNKTNIEGQWKGILDTGTAKLNLIFDFTTATTDSIVTTFYSIDQTDKPFTGVSTSFINNEISIEMPSIRASFKGKLVDGKTIDGTFTQGLNFPLKLKKMKDGEFVAYNESKYIENNELYSSFNVRIQNDSAGVILAGTVTLPKEGKNLPAVVLVTGSGAQNRDEELMGHKPFRRIADFLSSRGIAVLRYDDRGCFASSGDPINATTYDFLSDATTAVKFMKSYPNINPDNVGIVGHSEGGLIAMMAAAQGSSVDFIVSLAGPTITGDKLLLLQSEKISRASGVDEETIKKSNVVNDAVYAIVKQEADNKKAKLDIIATVKHYAFTEEMKKDAYLEQMANTVLRPWFRTFLVIDPADYLKDIKCPALFLFGEKDLQVPAVENEMTFWEKIGNKTENRIDIATIKDVNHLFQKADKGIPNEYANTDDPAMNDETLEFMYTWLKDVVY